MTLQHQRTIDVGSTKLTLHRGIHGRGVWFCRVTGYRFSQLHKRDRYNPAVWVGTHRYGLDTVTHRTLRGCVAQAWINHVRSITDQPEPECSYCGDGDRLNHTLYMCDKCYAETIYGGAHQHIPQDGTQHNDLRPADREPSEGAWAEVWAETEREGSN